MNVREFVARFLTEPLLKLELELAHHLSNGNHDHHLNHVNPHVIKANYVILGSGGAGLLYGLSLCWAEAGERVLIPSSYYAAFESGICILVDCVLLREVMKNPAL